ncbi:alpha/beta hydrolase [Actinoplanes oblitus]|uniref:Alpha/beta hydrolase n=1 Tax=Actinoplanes oblitus TaxID=3040509 RepID=A0ABY8WLY5_9ACTN|nr:alpha/beta hydrolase [Actinoplanes oblitus]WIM97349.1 alpha/beta hydrolase [Actinoplanes oblitus]
MSRIWIVAVALLIAPAFWLFGPTQAVATRLPGVAEWQANGLPDPTAAPAAIAAFFARLAPAEATELARRYPDVVGNLDGAPTALRYAANHSSPDRRILALDRRGDGRIVEVLGDLATASRVVILIPGVDTTLANFDTGLGGVERRAPAWQARQLHHELPGDTAVIAWLGYDPPEGIRRAALREDRAAAGALALRRFVDGLVAQRPDQRIVLVGHSYGSIVAGRAAAYLPAQVTDIAVLGSPGMGVADRAALGGTARIWAGSAPDDWTRKLPGIRVFGLGHGRLPIDPAFGALPLPADDVTGHDGYFATGTSTLRAIAQLATSRSGEIPRSASALASSAGSWTSSLSPSSPGSSIVS